VWTFGYFRGILKFVCIYFTISSETPNDVLRNRCLKTLAYVIILLLLLRKQNFDTHESQFYLRCIICTICDTDELYQ
jgi:hypothetical protein